MNAMRWAGTATLTLAVLLWSGTGQAQLPELPGLSGEVEQPKIRIATADTLVDRTRALRDTIDRRLQGLRKEQEAQASKADDDGPEALDRGSIERRIDVLERALAATGRALDYARADPDPQALPTSFDDVLNLFWVSLQATGEADEAAQAERLYGQPLGDVSTDASDLLVAQDYLFRAAALEAQAKARHLNAQSQAAAQVVEVTGADLTAAEASLRDASGAHQSALAAWRKRRKEQAPARDDVVPYELALQLEASELYLAEANLDLARARLHAIEQLSDVKSQGEALDTRVLRRLASVQQLLAASKIEAGNLAAQLGLLRPKDPDRLRRQLMKQQDRVRRQQSILGEAQTTLQRLRAVELLLESRYSEASGLSDRLRLSLSALLVLACVFLLAAGQRVLHVIVGFRGRLSRYLGLAPSTAAKLDAFLTLAWYVSVLALAVGVAVWGIWAVPLSWGNFWAALSYPLFLVDDKGVTTLSIFKFLTAFAFVLFASRIMRQFLDTRIYPALSWDTGLSNAINTLLHYLLLLGGLMIGLRFVGIGLSSLALFAGVLGIGIGFGLRNIAENFISGLIILAERPIKMGDFVNVAGSLEGKVQEIRARSTTVITRDNVAVIVPNSQFVGGEVTNWSHDDPKVRVQIKVGVAYGSNVDLVRRTLIAVAEKHGKILSRPAPDVWFQAFGSSSLDFVLLAWVAEPEFRYRVSSDLHFAIDAAFRRAEIEIAFPQLDLHVKSVSSQVLDNFRQAVLDKASTEPVAADDGVEARALPGVRDPA